MLSGKSGNLPGVAAEHSILAPCGRTQRACSPIPVRQHPL